MLPRRCAAASLRFPRACRPSPAAAIAFCVALGLVAFGAHGVFVEGCFGTGRRSAGPHRPRAPADRVREKLLSAAAAAMDLRYAAPRSGLEEENRQQYPPRRSGVERSFKAVEATDDEIFQWLQNQIEGPWGDVLDASTGPDSLQWLASVPLATLTAVAASRDTLETCKKEAFSKKLVDPLLDRLLHGSWNSAASSPPDVSGKKFDVIVADYLLGACEHVAPHSQLGVLRRLRGFLRPGGQLLLTGREPEPLGAEGDVERLMLDITGLRDSAMSLSRQYVYKEVPLRWVQEELQRMGFRIQALNGFPRRLTIKKVGLALEWAFNEISRVRDQELKQSLLRYHRVLVNRVKASLPLRREEVVFGGDYAIVATVP